MAVVDFEFNSDFFLPLIDLVNGINTTVNTIYIEIEKLKQYFFKH